MKKQEVAMEILKRNPNVVIRCHDLEVVLQSKTHPSNLNLPNGFSYNPKYGITNWSSKKPIFNQIDISVFKEDGSMWD